MGSLLYVHQKALDYEVLRVINAAFAAHEEFALRILRAELGPDLVVSAVGTGHKFSVGPGGWKPGFKVILLSCCAVQLS